MVSVPDLNPEPVAESGLRRVWVRESGGQQIQSDSVASDSRFVKPETSSSVRRLYSGQTTVSFSSWVVTLQSITINRHDKAEDQKSQSICQTFHFPAYSACFGPDSRANQESGSGESAQPQPGAGMPALARNQRQRNQRNADEANADWANCTTSGFSFAKPAVRPRQFPMGYAPTVRQPDNNLLIRV